jgi:spore coat protein U-like protein
MKKLSTLAAVLALASTGAFADTANMTVTANVPTACRLITVPALGFGTLDQVNAPAVNPAAVTLQYKCTNGTAPTGFTIGGSATGTFTGALSNGTDTIAYTIGWTAPTTAGTGLASTTTPIDVSLTGAMAGGVNYSGKSVGAYTQSVAVVITP